MNFGFHDEVYLPLAVDVSEAYSASELTINASGRVLVCADICIPEKVSLSVTLPVGEAIPDASAAALVKSARSLIPTSIDVKSGFSVSGEAIRLHIGLPFAQDHRVREVEYFPYINDLISNPAPQHYEFDQQGLVMELSPGFDFDEATADLSGIIVITEEAGGELKSAFEISTVDRGVGSADESISLMVAIAFAFLGGLILNLMPCVFPVLSIKILSLIESVHTDSGSLRLHGIVYSVGVVLSFIVIAAILIGLRLSGEVIGWGFQLQSPVVVGVLVYLFVVIGLNLLGLFEVGGTIMSVGSDRTGHGYGGSFATGILATVVAAPCTAPFMGVAVGFALTQSPAVSILVFSSLGAGMALPYLVLCYSPALLARLPRPGNWMVTLRQLLAFPMFASAIWLLWVLGIQAGPTGMMQVLGGTLLIAFALWVLGKSSGMVSRLTAVVLVIGAVYLVTIQRGVSVEKSASASDLSVQAYSAEALALARRSGPVLVNFTAAWCITCQVNELNAFSSDKVQLALAEHGVTYLKADWTNEDPLITEALQEYGRSGVPHYLLYRVGKDRAEVLPQILTAGIVLDAIESL